MAQVVKFEYNYDTFRSSSTQIFRLDNALLFAADQTEPHKDGSLPGQCLLPPGVGPGSRVLCRLLRLAGGRCQEQAHG